MTNDVVMPVAQRRDGNLVRVEEVEQGLAADAICLCCSYPVLARQGRKNQWHFSHQPAQSFAPSMGRKGSTYAGDLCNQETYLHQAGKLVLEQTLRDSISGGHPLRLTYDTECLHKRHFFTDVLRGRSFTVEVEAPSHGVRPDITLNLHDKPAVFMEVVVTHSPRTAVYAQGVPVVEFRIRHPSDLRRVESDQVHGLQATRLSNLKEHLICRDIRKPCRKCGNPVKGDHRLCFDCARHPCENCGKDIFHSGQFCSAECAASAKGLSICECGKWHSAEYDSCYDCSDAY